MASNTEDHAERCARWPSQLDGGVRGDAREQGARTALAKEPARQPGRRRERDQAKPRQQQWMTRQLQWAEGVGEQLLPTRDERVHQRLPGGRIGPDPALHADRCALHERCRAVVEWVRYGCRWLDPLEAVSRQRQAAEEGRP